MSYDPAVVIPGIPALAPAVPQTLILDGDDTLWDNNVFFERAIETFIDGLAGVSLDRTAVRAALDDIERANVEVYGYGVDSFQRSLVQCQRTLSGTAVSTDDEERLAALAQGVVQDRLPLIDGVAETLEVLSRRHTLYLLTKGDPSEQERKVELSGLAGYFAGVLIVPEKTVEVYRELVPRLGLTAAVTWMVGNSPRSDVLPALAAGLNAILVPHPQTWVLEHAEIPEPSDRFLILERLTELLRLF